MARPAFEEGRTLSDPFGMLLLHMRCRSRHVAPAAEVVALQLVFGGGPGGADQTLGPTQESLPSPPNEVPAQPMGAACRRLR